MFEAVPQQLYCAPIKFGASRDTDFKKNGENQWLLLVKLQKSSSLTSNYASGWHLLLDPHDLWLFSFQAIEPSLNSTLLNYCRLTCQAFCSHPARMTLK